MTMRKILRVTVPVAVAAALLAACGADTTATSSKRPAVIRVGARAAETAAAGVAPNAAADSKMAVWRQMKFLLGAGLQAPLGPRHAWTFPPAGTKATAGQKDALAKAFDLSGAWKDASKNFGAGYETIGDSAKGESMLTLTPDAMQSWWYSAAWDNSTVTACAEPAVGIADATESSTGSESVADGGRDSNGTVTVGSDGSTAATPTTIVDTKPTTAPDAPPPGVDCVPQPPKNVPTKAEAEAKAKALFEKLGLDPAKYVFETYADDWGAWVTGWLVLDDMKTQLAVGVGFGAEGVITGANGFLAEPVQADEYDLVSLDKAVERMNTQGGGYWGGGYGGGVTPMARGGVAVDVASVSAIASDVVVVPDTAPSAGSASGSANVGAGTSGTGTIVDPGLTPEPLPTDLSQPREPLGTVVPSESLPMETLEVTLTGVTMGLSQLWDADGNVWLIPSYVFTDANGGQYTVYAIADEFLDFTGINATVDTIPAETVPVDAVDTTVSATPVTDLPVDSGTTGSGTTGSGTTGSGETKPQG